MQPKTQTRWHMQRPWAARATMQTAKQTRGLTLLLPLLPLRALYAVAAEAQLRLGQTLQEARAAFTTPLA
eukprot:9868255-Alexandrium_andersonii.AAC.1